MSLSQLFEKKQVTSYELFPPKTPAGEKSLRRHVEQLMQFSPDFITCTYGAGGSTQGKTLDIIEEVKNLYNIPVASHLTLGEVRLIADMIWTVASDLLRT
ncbi:methylenetetrahydrofolate reductase [bacterium]|nr:methylenetetrahydrofolate reductase [bacterium]